MESGRGSDRAMIPEGGRAVHGTPCGCGGQCGSFGIVKGGGFGDEGARSPLSPPLALVVWGQGGVGLRMRRSVFFFLLPVPQRSSAASVASRPGRRCLPALRLPSWCGRLLSPTARVWWGQRGVGLRMRHSVIFLSLLSLPVSDVAPPVIASRPGRRCPTRPPPVTVLVWPSAVTERASPRREDDVAGGGDNWPST